MANRPEIHITLISLSAFTLKTSAVVGARSIISTDILETFINVYRQTTDTNHPVSCSLSLHDTITSEKQTSKHLQVPVHARNPPGVNFGPVELYPSMQEHRNPPSVFVHVEYNPQIAVSRHSSTSDMLFGEVSFLRTHKHVNKFHT